MLHARDDAPHAPHPAACSYLPHTTTEHELPLIYHLIVGDAAGVTK